MLTYLTRDPARVSAAVPSGVGFLGAGLIVKDIFKDDDGEMTHSIKGINTAASIWLSAAIGVACGGGLYFVATFTSALILMLLRFGPRQMERNDSILMSVLPIHHDNDPTTNKEHTEPVKETSENRASELVRRSSMKKKKSAATLNYD